MADGIVNRVAKSGIISINLEELLTDVDIQFIDLKDQLWQGLALREADFRVFIKEHDWECYRGSYVCIGCTVDAIVPVWAYMLVSTKLTGIAEVIGQGDPEVFRNSVIEHQVRSIDAEAYRDARVVVKGCSDTSIPLSAYIILTEKLTPVVRSLLFGEPCSTVPLYKQAKKQDGIA